MNVIDLVTVHKVKVSNDDVQSVQLLGILHLVIVCSSLEDSVR